ncbi:hypothetical protein [Sulfurisphaera tokodaii]|uniref:Uncharacterized protein n=2 Tax=Sulfurisphaera tokodaii TaxID=111955 RepID=Q976R3_SULTO|nr:hypothetical protein [Sulfurisphaera tokodaii]BAB65083.1 hypothetical protein STK_01280 [Sulfurisphaera tokodaii str. 7]HII74120.1 hypothetical protein [Sulfurisphaera tokodaii]
MKLLTFLDLDVDDRIAKANLEIALDDNFSSELRIIHINYVIERLKLLTPTQQLRIFDYLLYAMLKTNTDNHQLYNVLKSPKEDSIIYSITLLSIYNWNIIYNLNYFYPAKSHLIEGIIRKLRGKLPDIDVIERFLKEEIEEVGFDNAHLELLLLLDFIGRLRDKGYSVDLKVTYLGIIIDSNAPPEIRKEIRNSVVEDYKRFYNTDVRSFADSLYGMILSLEEFEKYARKVLGREPP